MHLCDCHVFFFCPNQFSYYSIPQGGFLFSLLFTKKIWTLVIPNWGKKIEKIQSRIHPGQLHWFNQQLGVLKTPPPWCESGGRVPLMRIRTTWCETGGETQRPDEYHRRRAGAESGASWLYAPVPTWFLSGGAGEVGVSCFALLLFPPPAGFPDYMALGRFAVCGVRLTGAVGMIKSDVQLFKCCALCM